MSLPALTGSQLIAWVERTSSKWRQLLLAHPEALNLPCDIRETSTVAQLLQHIVAVELRYAECLAALPQTGYDAIPFHSVEAIYSIHDRAMSLLAALDRHDPAWWDHTFEFATRSAGTLSAPRSVVFHHLLLHSIRHYAQLATLMRQHNIAPDWMMDYLDMRPDKS